MRRRAVVPIFLALTLLAAACGAGNKAAGPTRATELVITNNFGPDGVRTARAAGRFMDRVKQLSKGKLVINVVTGAFATNGHEVADVAAGHADLGWSGTRVFDGLGVKALGVLHTPFLIDSFELQDAVLRSEIAKSLRAATKPLGVETLAILGDGLRFPAAANKPLVSVSDWKQARVWLLDSEPQAAGVEALGGRVIHGGDIRQMLVDKAAEGLEDMWVYYVPSADYLYAPYITPNVVLSPRTTALFANPAAMARLTAAQRGWIHAAADDAAAWSRSHADDGIADYMRDACKYGARIALASADDLAALRHAVEPVYAAFRANPLTSANLAAIEALKAKLPPPAPLDVPDACRYEPGEAEAAAAALPKALTGPGTTGDFPRATYRYELSTDEVVQAGKAGSVLEASSAGVFTWEMGAGEWKVTAVPTKPGSQSVTCRGWYAVDGPTVTFTYGALAVPVDQHCFPPVWTVRWAPSDDGVRWGAPSAAVLAPYFRLHPWKRIG